MRVFISYSSKDEEYATTVSELLKTIGQDVFFAAETMRVGAQFESLLQQIKISDMLMVIWSEHARQSQWVTQEVGAGLSTVKYVCAVAIDETPLAGFLAHRTALLAYKEGTMAFPKLQRLVLKCQQELLEYRQKELAAKTQGEVWDGAKTLLALAGFIGIASALLGDDKSARR